ncbi:MAG: GIY-YIG nuclease family protein [Puniceicoccales bacterium]
MLVSSFYVYAIKNNQGRIYVGYTGDLEARLARHNSGYVKSTKAGVPWRFVKSQSFRTENEARFFERSLKRSKGKREKWIKEG